MGTRRVSDNYTNIHHNFDLLIFRPHNILHSTISAHDNHASINHSVTLVDNSIPRAAVHLPRLPVMRYYVHLTQPQHGFVGIRARANRSRRTKLFDRLCTVAGALWLVQHQMCKEGQSPLLEIGPAAPPPRTAQNTLKNNFQTIPACSLLFTFHVFRPYYYGGARTLFLSEISTTCHNIRWFLPRRKMYHKYHSKPMAPGQRA
jgi:hypothetical protein